MLPIQSYIADNFENAIAKYEIFGIVIFIPADVSIVYVSKASFRVAHEAIVPKVLHIFRLQSVLTLLMHRV